MLPAVRMGDAFFCPTHGGGVVVGPCCMGVQIGGAPAARVGDGGPCGSSGTIDSIVRGNPTVLMGNQAAAGLLKQMTHGGKLAGGCGTVFLGDPPLGPDGNLLPVPDACTYLVNGLQSVATKGAPAEGLDALRDTYKISKPKQGAWDFSPLIGFEPVDVYDIVIRGHHVKVMIPRNVSSASGGGVMTPSGRWLPGPSMVAASLATLSDEQLKGVHTVAVSPHDYPDDLSVAAGAAYGQGVITYYPRGEAHPQSDIDWAMAHEGAHAVSAGLGWTTEAGKQKPPSQIAWEDAILKDARKISDYGRTNIMEDFAEAVLMYAMTKGTPCEATARALFPNRYAEMDKIFPNGYRPRRK